MANITNYLNKIKTAVYGKDVRGAIHDAIKQVYDDASVNHDNANMEVKMARGTHNTLKDRLDNVDETQAQTNAQLFQKANNRDLEETNERISKIIANNSDTNGNTELLDIRTINNKNFSIAGDAVRSITKGNLHKRVFVNPFLSETPIYEANGQSISLNSFIKNIEIHGASEDMLFGVAMVLRTDTSNSIALYVYNGETAVDGKGIFFTPKKTNDSQIVKGGTVIDGVNVTIYLTIENWMSIGSHEKRSIPYSVSGISMYCYSNFVTQSYLNNEFATIIDEKISELKKHNFITNYELLENMFIDVQLTGFKGNAKLAIGYIRKKYTAGGTRPIENAIAIFTCNEDGTLNGANRVFTINFSDTEATSDYVKKVVSSKFDGKDVKLKATINWSLLNGNEVNVGGLTNYNVCGFTENAYLSDYSEFERTVTLANKTTDKPIITFIDDDGKKAFLEKSKPVYDKYDVKASVAVVSGWIGSSNNELMTVEQLKSLNSEGYEIVSHTHTHAFELYKEGQITATDEDIVNDMKLSFEKFKELDLETDTVVWAWGNFSNVKRYEKALKQYFKYGINANGGVITSEVLHDAYLDRKFLQFNVNNMEYYKALVDSCASTNGWLIFGTHSISDEFTAEQLDELVAYIKSKGVEIKTFKEAIKYKGNICSIGIYNEKGSLYIGRNGIVMN